MPKAWNSHSRAAGVAAVVLQACSLGCGATPAANETAANEASSGGTSDSVATDEAPAETAAGTGAGAPAVLIVGAISWQLFQPLRIDAAGDLFEGSRRAGRLAADGTLTDERGVVTARLDEAGWVVVAERRTHLRIGGDHVVEVGDAPGSDEDVMRIENGELVVGSGHEEERFVLEGFRHELAAEVLFVSAVAVAGMAAAYSH